MSWLANMIGFGKKRTKVEASTPAEKTMIDHKVYGSKQGVMKVERTTYEIYVKEDAPNEEKASAKAHLTRYAHAIGYSDSEVEEGEARDGYICYSFRGGERGAGRDYNHLIYSNIEWVP